MNKEQIIEKWNNYADEYNQWDVLSADEQVEYVIKVMNKKIADLTPKVLVVGSGDTGVSARINGLIATTYSLDEFYAAYAHNERNSTFVIEKMPELAKEPYIEIPQKEYNNKNKPKWQRKKRY